MMSGKIARIIGLNIVKLTKWLVFFRASKDYKSMPKRTYQPKKRHRAREHGFLKRMASKAGRNVLQRRRNKGRVELSK